MNQITVDRRVLARLIEHYLRLEIQMLQHIVASPSQPHQHVVNITLLQGRMYSLLTVFEQCETSEDYAACFEKLEKIWDEKGAAESNIEEE